MRNAKKFLAFLLTAVMLLSSVACLTVFAETEDADAYVLDFTKYISNVSAKCDVEANAATLDNVCDNGYLTVTATAANAGVTFTTEAGYAVVKFRAMTSAVELSLAGQNVAIVNNGMWQVVSFDTALTAGEATLALVGGAEGDAMDIAYVAVYATAEEAAAAVAAEVTTEELNGNVESGTPVFEIAGKKYVAESYEALTEAYTVEGFRAFANGKDTGFTVATATDGVQYVITGSLIEVVATSAEDIVIEIDGERYLYEGATALKPLYQAHDVIKPKDTEFERFSFSGILDKVDVMYEGDTEYTNVLTNAAGDTWKNDYKKLRITNQVKEFVSIKYTAWIIAVDANIDGTVVEAGVVANDQYYGNPDWIQVDEELIAALGGNQNARRVEFEVSTVDWAEGAYNVNLAFKTDNGTVYIHDVAKNAKFTKYSDEGETPAIFIDANGVAYKDDENGLIGMKNDVYYYFTGLRNVNECFESNGKTYAYVNAYALETNYVNIQIPDNFADYNTYGDNAGTKLPGLIMNEGDITANGGEIMVHANVGGDLNRDWLVNNAVKDTYGIWETLEFDLWTGGNPIAFGYQIGEEEAVFDPAFITKDDSLIPHGGTHRGKIVVPVGELEFGNYNILLLAKFYDADLNTFIVNMIPVWPVVQFVKGSAEADNLKDENGRLVCINEDGSILIDGKTAPANTMVVDNILYEGAFEVVKDSEGDLYVDLVALTQTETGYTDADGNAYAVTEGGLTIDGVAAEGKIVTVGEAAYYASAASDVVKAMPDSYAYDVTIAYADAPEIPEHTYTIVFMADDVKVAEFTYVEGEEIIAPEVPAKEGYTAAWETYELFSADDIVVKAVYTSTETETETESESVTEAPAASESETEEEGGCGSVVGVSTAVVLMAAAAAAVVLKKKED